jgi:hypothetical protein
VAATFDDGGTTMLGFVVFFGTMKLLRLLRVSERLNTLTETLKRARPELMGFSVVFAIFYTAFCTLFYLVLSPLLTSFSSYLLTLEEAFSAILGKFDMGEIRGASGFGATIYFSTNSPACNRFSFSVHILHAVHVFPNRSFAANAGRHRCSRVRRCARRYPRKIA